MEPRDYQDAARNVGVWEYMSTRNGNPCVVMPTGSGKTLVIALVCMDAVQQWGGRVLVLSHVKELINQSHKTLKALCPSINVGVNSAGLNRRDTSGDVVVAGVQSVHRDVTKLGAFDLVVVDEAHLIPPSGDGMYRNVIRDLQAMTPHVRLVGMTATPYRTSSGYLCGPDELLTEISYEVGIPELINRGFLSPIINRADIDVDTSGLHIRSGEFVASEAELLMADVISPACENIVENTRDRRSVLVFCQSIAHCEEVSQKIEEISGERAGVVHSQITSMERQEALRRFESGALRYLVNVDVLTTGYDNPRIDCVALLRCTCSPGLYYQMVGRGFRIADGKDNCLVLDYGGNIKRHGPVDEIKPREKRTANGDVPTKLCVACEKEINAATRRCPFCGTEQPIESIPKTHDVRPDNSSAIISSGNGLTRHEVEKVEYRVHYKNGFFKGDPDAPPPTLRVDYHVGERFPVSEWVCLEHDGYAGRKAAAWWRKRCKVEPESVEDAVAIAERGLVAEPIEIYTKADGKYQRVQRVILGDVPEAEDEHLMDWLTHETTEGVGNIKCPECGGGDTYFDDTRELCFSCDSLVRIW